MIIKKEKKKSAFIHYYMKLKLIFHIKEKFFLFYRVKKNNFPLLYYLLLLQKISQQRQTFLLICEIFITGRVNYKHTSFITHTHTTHLKCHMINYYQEYQETENYLYGRFIMKWIVMLR